MWKALWLLCRTYRRKLKVNLLSRVKQEVVKNLQYLIQLIDMKSIVWSGAVAIEVFRAEVVYLITNSKGILISC